jgi:Mor family transcriptional regulator
MHAIDDLSDDEIKSVLPSSLRFLAEQGVPIRALLVLVDKFGGSTLKVPAREADRSKLGRLIGEEATKILVRLLGGDSIYLPKATSLQQFLRSREILRMRNEGAKISDIARHFNITERAVAINLSRSASSVRNQEKER